MLKGLENIRSKVIASQEGIDKHLSALVDDIADAKTAEMRKGIGGDGKKITPAYALMTKQYKDESPLYNAPSGTPDLHDKGKFYRAIYTKRNGYDYNFMLNNPPPYAMDLMKKYLEPKMISPKGTKELDQKSSITLSNEFRKIWK